MNLQDIQVKICGMRDVENILQVAECRPSYLGFIFYTGSPRYVGDNFTPPILPFSIEPVGVFVNEATWKIQKIASHTSIKVLQLHGTESVEQCSVLNRLGFKIIKAFSVDDDFDFDLIEPYKSVVDYFLFDTKGKNFGGNGQMFNWKILKKYDQEVPFFLSGGLTPDRIALIKELSGMNVHALDLNSGVEDSPGTKSLTKVREAIQNINSIKK